MGQAHAVFFMPNWGSETMYSAQHSFLMWKKVYLQINNLQHFYTTYLGGHSLAQPSN